MDEIIPPPVSKKPSLEIVRTPSRKVVKRKAKKKSDFDRLMDAYSIIHAVMRRVDWLAAHRSADADGGGCHTRKGEHWSDPFPDLNPYGPDADGRPDDLEFTKAEIRAINAASAKREKALYPRCKAILEWWRPPSADELANLNAALDAALAPVKDALATKAEILAILAGMTVALGSAAVGQVTDSFVDALLFSIESDEETMEQKRSGVRGFRPPVVMLAAFKVFTGRIPRVDAKGRVTMGGGTWMPSIADFLVVVRQARADYIAARNLNRQIHTVVRDAEYVVWDWREMPADSDDDLPSWPEPSADANREHDRWELPSGPPPSWADLDRADRARDWLAKEPSLDQVDDQIAAATSPEDIEKLRKLRRTIVAAQQIIDDGKEPTP